MVRVLTVPIGASFGCSLNAVCMPVLAEEHSVRKLSSYLTNIIRLRGDAYREWSDEILSAETYVIARAPLCYSS
jgi:hypothetical protein